MRIILLLPFIFCFCSVALAEIKEVRIEYKQGSTPLSGYLYSDDALAGPRPGVIVFSDWMGIGEFAKQRGRELAELGYRAFVADIYGNGRLAKDPKEAGELAEKYKSNRPLMRERAQAAFDALMKNTPVDPPRVAAIGFCFGGTVALELARAGAMLAGVVSFHGGLDTPDPALAKNIKASVLILHGAEDPFVPEGHVKAFEDEMRNAKVSYELVKYSDAVHSFTNEAAGTDNTKGAAYNAQAAARSFERMRDFFVEIFG